jgi:hypothetical protein
VAAAGLLVGIAAVAPGLRFAAAVDLSRLVLSVAVVTALVAAAGAARPRGWLIDHAPGLLVILGLGGSGLIGSSALSPHHPLAGDEPAYLVMASSLVHDLDLDLANNYRQRDYKAFDVPAYRAFGHRGPDGRLYPHHGPGLGVLLAPLLGLGQALRGSVGTEGIVLMLRLAMGLVVGVSLALAFRLACERGAEPIHALGAAAAAGLSCPLLFYSTQLYPDVPAGALLAVLVLKQPPLWAVITSGLLLPLLGVKFLLPAAVLGAGAAIRFGSGRRRGAMAATLLALAAGAAAFWLTRPPVDLEDHLTAQAGARLAFAPWWLFGYLLDQRAGLIALAPIYFIGAAGLSRLDLRRDGPMLAASGLYVAVYAYHLDWGGLCPPGRPLLAVIWLPILLMALGFPRVSSWIRSPLAIASGLISAAYLLDHRSLFLHLHPNAQAQTSPLLAAWSLPQFDLTRLAPFVSVDHTATPANLAGLALLGLGVAAVLKFGRAAGPRLGGASTILWLLGALAFAGLMAWASRIDPTRRLEPVFDGKAGRLWTDAGPEWTDGWVPASRWVRCWVRLEPGARLELVSAATTDASLHGRRLAQRIELRPGVPVDLELPTGWAGRLERLEIRVRNAASPASLAKGADPRLLGCRLALVR